MSDRAAELGVGIEPTPTSADTGEGEQPLNQRAGFSIQDDLEYPKPEVNLYPPGSDAERGRQIAEQWKTEQGSQGPSQAELDREYVEADQTLQAVTAAEEALEYGDEDDQAMAFLELKEADPQAYREAIAEMHYQELDSRGEWFGSESDEDYAEAMNEPTEAQQLEARILGLESTAQLQRNLSEATAQRAQAQQQTQKEIEEVVSAQFGDVKTPEEATERVNYAESLLTNLAGNPTMLHEQSKALESDERVLGHMRGPEGDNVPATALHFLQADLGLDESARGYEVLAKLSAPYTSVADMRTKLAYRDALAVEVRERDRNDNWIRRNVAPSRDVLAAIEGREQDPERGINWSNVVRRAKQAVSDQSSESNETIKASMESFARESAEPFRSAWSIGRAGEDRPATFAEAEATGRPRDAYGRFVRQS
jgi:hypothetical protein